MKSEKPWKRRCPWCKAVVLLFDRKISHEAPMCAPFAKMLKDNLEPPERETVEIIVYDDEPG